MLFESPTMFNLHFSLYHIQQSTIPSPAGDFVKFGLPMASSVTLLAWGLIEYREAYRLAGELEYGLDCIKWPLDYFIKAHVADNKFYGQVAA